MTEENEEMRVWYVNEVLSTVNRCIKVLPELTKKEVLKALEIESSSLRRKSIVNRLIGRAARINELEYVNKLKVRYRYAT